MTLAKVYGTREDLEKELKYGQYGRNFHPAVHSNRLRAGIDTVWSLFVLMNCPV